MNYKQIRLVLRHGWKHILFKEICLKILEEENHILHSFMLGRGRSESKMP